MSKKRSKNKKGTLTIGRFCKIDDELWREPSKKG